MGRWLLLAVLLLGGCMAADSAKIGSPPGGPDTGGSSGSNPGPGGGGGGSAGKPPAVDGGAADGAVSGPSECARLLPVSTASFADVPAAPGAKLRVRVLPRDPGAPPVTWTWTVLFGEGAGTDVPVTTLDPLAAEVDVPTEKPGRYQLAARAAIRDQPCVAGATAFATPAASRLGHFRVRVTPPAGLFPVQEIPIQAKAGLNVSQPLTVRQGTPVAFQPSDESGTGGINSYVRVSQLGSSLIVEGHTGRADFKPPLLAVYPYDVLIVPDTDVAPFQVLGQTPAMLNVLPQKLSRGGALTGQLHDGAGAPLKDGRVILRAGALTSTVGRSAAGGDFTLRVRAGQFAITASPDPDSGLPELTLPADTGLTISDGAAVGTVDLKWAAASPVAVGLVVRTADGAAAATGARVRLEGGDSIPVAGTLIYTPPSGAPITRSVPGYVRVNGQVAADGSTSLPRVPPGSYRLVITPADGDRLSGLTTIPLEVPAAGVSGQAVRLAARVKLRGRLLPAQTAAGVRVYAAPKEQDPPRPVASATVAADGSYQVDVDPARSYVVWVDPGLDKNLARSQLAIVDAGAAGADVPDRNLTKALRFSGFLRAEAAGTPIANGVIQVFCDVATASCLDPTIPLSEGVSDSKGGFLLSLPDPGSF